MSTTEERTPEKAAVALRGVPGETRPVKKKKATSKRGGARPGAGRKPAMGSDPQTVAFRLPAEQKRQLEKWCADRDVDKSDALRWMVRDLLAGLWSPSQFAPRD